MRTVFRRKSAKKPKKKEFVIAIDDFTPSESDSWLTFKKGDQFLLKSDANADCWYVKSIDSNALGYAPPCLLVRGSDIFSYEWVSFNTTRSEAECALMRPKVQPGAFMILPQEDNSISLTLTLSVKVRRPINTENFTVDHFLIRRMGRSFCFEAKENSVNVSFDTLSDLVQYHAARHNGSNIYLTYSLKKREFVSLWEYDIEAIEQGERLGSGCYGEVCIGKLNGKIVAIKSPTRDPKEFLKEAQLARHCDHLNVVETIGICTSPPLIIAEYLKNGSLREYLLELASEGEVFSSAECISVALKIASGMEYLANRKIVHRDLAARNILVGETIQTIKVADFGLARNLIDSSYYYSEKESFPFKWTAPEGFFLLDGMRTEQKGRVTSAADVWAFGVVMWELYTMGQEPYVDIGKDQVKELHDKLTGPTNSRLNQPDECPDKVYEVMLNCWNLEPKNRPTFTALRTILSDLDLDERPLFMPFEEDRKYEPPLLSFDATSSGYASQNTTSFESQGNSPTIESQL